MVEFGVCILTTEEWNPGSHLHNDRGRYLIPDARDTLPAVTVEVPRHETFTRLTPTGASWTHSFVGTAGEVNGGGSPFTALADNNSVGFKPVTPTLQSAVSAVIKPPGAPGTTWRPEFVDRMTTFRGGIRVMDLCGTQSDYRTARDPASAGSWSGMRRRCPRTYGNTANTRYLWHNDGAWSLDELLKFGEIASELHFCVPPILMRSENIAELIVWLTAISNIPGLTRAWIEPSNEVWNLTLGNAPYAKLVYDEAILYRLGRHYDPPYHWITAMAEHYARTAMGLKIVCDSISPKLVTILAWQSGNLDPWVLDHWANNRPVNPYCYEALNTIGHMFIAPYFKYPTMANVQLQFDLINQWRTPHPGGNAQYHADLDGRGVMLHAYEAGQHFDDPTQHPVSLQTTPATLALWDVYLRGLHERMAPNARVYLYGLAGPWAPGSTWGLLEDIAVNNAKWDQVKATIEAIRFIQPVLP